VYYETKIEEAIDKLSPGNIDELLEEVERLERDVEEGTASDRNFAIEQLKSF
jgi:hypothetical protein